MRSQYREEKGDVFHKPIRTKSKSFDVNFFSTPTKKEIVTIQTEPVIETHTHDDHEARERERDYGVKF